MPREGSASPWLGSGIGSQMRFPWTAEAHVSPSSLCRRPGETLSHRSVGSAPPIGPVMRARGPARWEDEKTTPGKIQLQGKEKKKRCGKKQQQQRRRRRRRRQWYKQQEQQSPGRAGSALAPYPSHEPQSPSSPVIHLCHPGLLRAERGL